MRARARTMNAFKHVFDFRLVGKIRIRLCLNMTIELNVPEQLHNCNNVWHGFNFWYCECVRSISKNQFEYCALDGENERETKILCGFPFKLNF